MVSLIKSVFTGFQEFRQDQLQMAEVLPFLRTFGLVEFFRSRGVVAFLAEPACPWA